MIFPFIIAGILLALGSQVNAAAAVSSLGLQTVSFVGDKAASLNGSYGYGIDARTMQEKGVFRLSMGGNFLYSSANSYIQESAYKSTLFSADLVLGAALVPFGRARMSPYLGIYGLGGFKYLELINPPADVSSSGLSLSYGFMVSIGVQVQTKTSSFYDISIDYVSNTAPELADQKSFDLSGLGVKLAIGFR